MLFDDGESKYQIVIANKKKSDWHKCVVHPKNEKLKYI